MFQAQISDIERARWHTASQSNLKKQNEHTIIDLILSSVQGAGFSPWGTYAVHMVGCSLKATELENKLIDFLFVSNSILVALNII